MPERYTLDDLRTLMARLRDPRTGCPWDLRQNWQSIVPHTLEEAYEVADAIERGDFSHIAEELGDLLFQVVFYAQLAEEEGRFEWADIVDGIVRKLLRRHPHVFPEGTLDSERDPSVTPEEAEIRANWEAIKAAEKSGKAQADEPASLLDAVPAGLPELTRALELQKRAATVGFDWPDVEPVFAKVEEELSEVREAVAEGDQDHVEAEIGDLLFVCVNLARALKVDPAQALRRTNRKFEARFRSVEKALRASGKDWGETSLEEMDRWWDAAKAGEKPA
ncbi:nucleoside triphosphate pyrophosphohydrolase [Hahella sp. SMD15-11]|uniref:Nucleoside triphosphate pyrophosphohydrolase n=1 Tax=Thermohahella caldifontis TaxID=3142973 RepID=A0AB39V126_9GAMM